MFKKTQIDSFQHTKLNLKDKKPCQENEPPNSRDSSREQLRDVLLHDLIQILEVNPRTKKMLHAQTLAIYTQKRVSDQADKDK